MKWTKSLAAVLLATFVLVNAGIRADEAEVASDTTDAPEARLVATPPTTAPAPAATSPSPDPAAVAALATKLAPSLVRVEYVLQFDKGEAPAAGGWATRCPSCGSYHGNDAAQVVRDDRPFETAGFVTAPGTVVTADPLIHPRFIKSISVRHGDDVVHATPVSYAKDQTAVTLRLDGELKTARPLKFDAAAPGPYLAVTYTQANGEWTVSAQPAGGTVSAAGPEGGRRYVAVPSYSLIVTAAGGVPVALAMRDELPVDGSWKGPPSKWPSYSADELAKLLDGAREAATRGLLRVTVNLRSPKAKSGARMYGSMSSDDESSATVQHAVGVLIDPRTLLVLLELKPSVTARLERIKVQVPGENKPRDAKFAFSLADYGAFVATLAEPAGTALPIAKSDPLACRGLLVPAAQVQLQGEKRVEYFNHRRIASFNTGWRRQLYPEIPGDAAQNLFLFDPTGALLALPVTRRDKESQRERWAGAPTPVLTLAKYVAAAAADPAKNSDPGNVPLSEAEENRLAWLGVELQGLTPELARANDVSDLTNDGQSGALVTYVYPDSPAAKQGIETGDVLLRVHVEGEPKPIDVTVEPYAFGDQPFPWDRFDQLPEQYFDQIPQPWPSVENTLTRALTDLGFGKQFTAELARGGKPLTKEFTVVQSPPHFDSAPRYKAEALGLTVKDLTYEVRRYFQRAPEDPGVLVAKIEMGSKASVAGLKPFEVITHVNEQPVADAKQFEQAVKGQTDLRLSIKRMTKGRQVKIKLPPPKDAKAGAPSTRPAKGAPTTRPARESQMKSETTEEATAPRATDPDDGGEGDD